MKQKKKRSAIRRLGDLVILLIIFSLLGTAAWLLYQEFFPNNTPVLKMQVMENNDDGTVTIDWNALKQTNPDTIGWLSIEGTNIDTPIVQTTDNDLYLYTAFDGSQDERGVPFLDRDYQWGVSRNAVIYGHSTMRSGVHVMFDDLMSYADNPSYADIYGKMVLRRPPELGGDATYQIFAILIQEAEYDYRQPNFTDEQSFIDYYTRIQNDSRYYNPNVTVASGDEILTLSTCIFNVGLNDGRLAVIGKRIA